MDKCNFSFFNCNIYYIYNIVFVFFMYKIKIATYDKWSKEYDLGDLINNCRI